jgi:hypothetical protein
MFQDIFDCEVLFLAVKSVVFVEPNLVDMYLKYHDSLKWHCLRYAELLYKAKLEHLNLISRSTGQVYLLSEMSTPQNRKLQVIVNKLYLTSRTLHRYLKLKRAVSKCC